jgi:hypothetical protein
VKRIRQHLTYANVMSTLAVFLVLGGATAFAVSEALPGKSVGTAQLKNGAVTPAKLRKGAVTRIKLGKGAVTGAKLRNGAVTGAKINESTLGPVPSATSALTATTAANAATSEGPIAFAHVSANGAMLDARGVTVTTGVKESAEPISYYCFSGLAFAPRGIIATPDYRNETPNFNTMLQAALESRGGLEGTGCPAGTQAYVHGVRASVNGLTSSSPVGFYVLFFR